MAGGLRVLAPRECGGGVWGGGAEKGRGGEWGGGEVERQDVGVGRSGGGGVGGVEVVILRGWGEGESSLKLCFFVFFSSIS